MSDDSKKSKGDYEVGFCRPPKHSRFKKGQSGNPRGRPRKSNDLNALVRAELATTIVVHEAGREKRITKREAIIKQVVNRAIKGDAKASQFVLTHMEKHREIEPFTPTEADDAALLAAMAGSVRKDEDDGNR